jgi:hypothetical protein
VDVALTIWKRIFDLELLAFVGAVCDCGIKLGIGGKMKRVLCQQPIPEGASANHALVPAAERMDTVTCEIRGGTLSFAVPPYLPDDQVLQGDWMGENAYCVLELDCGSKVTVWIRAAQCGIDVQKPAALPLTSHP